MSRLGSIRKNGDFFSARYQRFIARQSIAESFKRMLKRLKSDRPLNTWGPVTNPIWIRPPPPAMITGRVRDAIISRRLRAGESKIDRIESREGRPDCLLPHFWRRRFHSIQAVTIAYTSPCAFFDTGFSPVIRDSAPNNRSGCRLISPIMSGIAFSPIATIS